MNDARSYADYAAETNAKVLATITPNQAWVDYFRAIKAIWQPAYGDWPTDAMLTAAVMLAAKQGRPGIECWHIALCLRPKGCEVAQYTSSATSSGITGRAVGPANNKRKAIVEAQLCTQFEQHHNGSKAAAFTLVFTPKGAAFIARQVAYQAAFSTAGQVTPKMPATVPHWLTSKLSQPAGTQVPAAETPTSDSPKPAEGVIIPQVVNELVDIPEGVGGVEPDYDEVRANEPISNEALAALATHFNN